MSIYISVQLHSVAYLIHFMKMHASVKHVAYYHGSRSSSDFQVAYFTSMARDHDHDDGCLFQPEERIDGCFSLRSVFVATVSDR